MKHISTFSGIGGFDLAAQRAGWENIASCEINPFGQRVLQHYWPDAYHHDDIHTLTKQLLDEKLGQNWNTGDVVLSRGFPCQPYSSAGKRLGKDDDRHLWPEMLRVIREIAPRWVVGENVRGLINWSDGLVFEEVQTDLEAAGYEVLPFMVPACGVNAPHRRDRVWFVAHRDTKQRERPNGGFQSELINESYAITAYATSKSGGGQHEQRQKQGESGGYNSEGIATHPHSNERRERGLHAPKREEAERHAGTRNAPAYERNAWQNFPTQPPICGRDDGLPARLDGITFSKWRKESIKAYGNAIVPQVAFEIFQAINEYETIFSQHKP